jgi:hypothetical protein
MKAPFKRNVAFQISGLTMIFALFCSCSTANRIFSEHDIVYSTARFELKYHFRDRDRRTPLYFFTQTIVREVNKENVVSYTAYDVLTLSGSSFRMDEKVILVIDDKAYPMIVDRMELENVRSISGNTTDILTADSATVSVVTGYSENNRKITRFSYNIPGTVISKIKESDQIFLRYYSGPSMITVRPKKKSINKIKELIALT